MLAGQRARGGRGLFLHGQIAAGPSIGKIPLGGKANSALRPSQLIIVMGETVEPCDPVRSAAARGATTIPAMVSEFTPHLSVSAVKWRRHPSKVP